MASNMGFKINKSLQNGFATGGAPKGDNWMALPYSNPYTNFTNLCNAFTGATKSTITVSTLNPVTGAFTNVNCAVGSATAIASNAGLRVRVTGATPPANPNQVVLVGSSNEAAALPTVLGAFSAAGAPKKDIWISVPYHTTWINAFDICTTLGIGAGAGNVARINSVTGVTTTANCAVSGNFGLVIGESVRVRKTAAGDVVGVLPPHF